MSPSRAISESAAGQVDGADDEQPQRRVGAARDRFEQGVEALALQLVGHEQDDSLAVAIAQFGSRPAHAWRFGPQASKRCGSYPSGSTLTSASGTP